MKKVNESVTGKDSDTVKVKFTKACTFMGKDVLPDKVKSVTIGQAKLLKQNNLIEEY